MKAKRKSSGLGDCGEGSSESGVENLGRSGRRCSREGKLGPDRKECRSA